MARIQCLGFRPTDDHTGVVFKGVLITSVLGFCGDRSFGSIRKDALSYLDPGRPFSLGFCPTYLWGISLKGRHPWSRSGQASEAGLGGMGSALWGSNGMHLEVHFSRGYTQENSQGGQRICTKSQTFFSEYQARDLAREFAGWFSPQRRNLVETLKPKTPNHRERLGIIGRFQKKVVSAMCRVAPLFGPLAPRCCMLT